MAKKTHNMFHGQFVFEGKNLIPRGGSTKYEAFLKTLEQGQSVEVFLESNPDDGTLTQIAKIKVCIRELAKEVGETFEEMQVQVKRSSGLCLKKNIQGENYLICKSFGDCSKEELSMAIETIISMGDNLNINFR
jgi:hypothetical protein